jgi:hypothetical protein
MLGYINMYNKSLFCLSLTAFFISLHLHAQGTFNGVQNGSFETITVVPGVETRARPWQGQLAYNEGWPNAPQGTNYARISTAFQDVSTRPGGAYILTFSAAADLFDEQVGTIVISWGGQNIAAFKTKPHQYDPGRNRDLQIVWEGFQIPPVIAPSSLTRLEFGSPDSSGIWLDNVRLLEIPEPSPISLLLIGLGLFFATFGIRRKT